MPASPCAAEARLTVGGGRVLAVLHQSRPRFRRSGRRRRGPAPDDAGGSVRGVPARGRRRHGSRLHGARHRAPPDGRPEDDPPRRGPGHRGGYADDPHRRRSARWETPPTPGPFAALEARFLQEAWVTGGLEHPGIVPVYELGQTPAGIPYYTMKFIASQRTMADAIDEVRGAPMEERLGLLEPFLKLCDTVPVRPHERRDSPGPQAGQRRPGGLR